jgi:hypothetical protein
MGKTATRSGNMTQGLTDLSKDLLVSLGQQLPLMAAAFANAHDRPACHGDGSIIHDRNLLSALPREDVLKTPTRSRLNVRRQISAATTPAEEMTQLQAILEHCKARVSARFSARGGYWEQLRLGTVRVR